MEHHPTTEQAPSTIRWSFRAGAVLQAIVIGTALFAAMIAMFAAANDGQLFRYQAF